jgi:hypothetical protein
LLIQYMSCSDHPPTQLPLVTGDGNPGRPCPKMRGYRGPVIASRMATGMGESLRKKEALSSG